MTKDRDFKKLARRRAAETGESYQSARRRLVAKRERGSDVPNFPAVHSYFRGWIDHVTVWAEQGGPWRPYDGPVPVGELRDAALRHPSPKVRRESLGVLDHEAADASADVFRQALADPVPRVRLSALHGLACERCRDGELCVPDVVPDLVSTLDNDGSAKVRHAAALVLAAFVERDERVRPALMAASENDPDDLVKVVARAAADGDRRLLKSRKALRRRQRRTSPDDVA